MHRFCDLAGECMDTVDINQNTTFKPPKFQWINSSEVLVTFQDGSMDVIHLTMMNNIGPDNCLFDGKFEVEENGMVALVGCYNTSAEAMWEISVVSSRIPPMNGELIWWANGTVNRQPEPEPEGCESDMSCPEETWPESIDRRQQGPGLASTDPIPTDVRLEFDLRYDNSMKDKYGDGEAAYITNQIASRGCAFLRTRSIIPRVHCSFSYPTLYPKYFGGTNGLVGSNVQNHYLPAGSKPRHIITDNNGDGALGRVHHIGLKCPTARDDLAVTEHGFYAEGRDVHLTSKTFAHEIGHWLGIYHDFQTPGSSGRYPNHAATSCNGNGLMSYGSMRPIDWSDCSNSDWQKEYRATQHRCRSDYSSGVSSGLTYA